MIFHWPQITTLISIALGVLVYAVLDGKPREDQYKLSEKMLDAIITLFVLYEGGFFAGVSPS